MSLNYYLYVSLSKDNKILRFGMDLETGQLRLQAEMALAGGPSALAVDPTQHFLYAGLRAHNEIASFRIDQQSGELTPLNTSALDSDPCYLATDQNGRFLLAAYYRAGKVTVHPINADGTVGSRPSCAIPTAEHAHCIQTDRSNRFAFVPHTAPPNAIFQFRFDETTGNLVSNDVAHAGADAGPRHFVFHPSKELVYTSNENGSSVTAYHFEATTGTLTAFQTLSTLPERYDGENTCAQIHIHPTGKFLYVSNRGHDSLAYFAIEDNSGRLTALGQQKTEPTPRVFNLDPTGQYLFAAGQGSGRLAAYRVDSQAGTLQPLGQYPLGEQPMWVMVLGLG